MEHSPNYQKVSDHYRFNRWNEQMVLNAVGRWITEEEAQEILSSKGE